MDYAKISKSTIDHLYSAYGSLKASSLSSELKSLIELYVSSMNGCNYCCNLHKNEALQLGISENKLDSLFEFAESDSFSNAEKEALNWAKSLTKLEGNKKVLNTELARYFSEKEIVDLTICISLMNTFNRLAISMRSSS